MKNLLILATMLLSYGFADAQAKSTDIKTINGKKYYIHKVEKGQSLYAIAKTYNRAVNSILAENDDAIDGLNAGQELKIPFDTLMKTPILVKFQTIKIGTQVWMTKNLNVDKNRKGEIIPQAKTAEEWLAAAKNEQPAWCYYNNDPAYGLKYGKLYNWYAVKFGNFLAPEGYHVPTDDEWQTLTNFLDGQSDQSGSGTKMKSNEGWNEAGNGSNSSGFDGLPSGARDQDGAFSTIGYYGYWWSSTQDGVFKALNSYLSYNKTWASWDKSYRECGFSVRCIKNSD